MFNKGYLLDIAPGSTENKPHIPRLAKQCHITG